MLKKDYFTIPNLMGYFRILLIPVFMVLYYKAESQKEYMVALAVLLISFLSDFFDGKIARRFNCVTDFGKMLDPFADKLTQCAIAIAVALRVPSMKVFLVLFVCREFYMSIVGLYILKKYQAIPGAQMFGKVCTWVIDFGVMALLFMNNMSYKMTYGIVAFMTFALLVTWVLYLRFHIKLIRQCKEKAA